MTDAVDRFYRRTWAATPRPVRTTLKVVGVALACLFYGAFVVAIVVTKMWEPMAVGLGGVAILAYLVVGIFAVLGFLVAAVRG